MTSPDTEDELNEVVDSFLPTIPPERHGVTRPLLRTSHRRRPRQLAASPPIATTDEHAADPDGTPPPHPSRPASHLPMTPERALQIADDLILAALRTAGATGHTPLSPPNHQTRIAVRPDREPLDHTVRLSDVAPEPLRWLWPGRIPIGKITVLDGDPGLGKSTLLCEIAARVSRGEPLPGAGSAPVAPRGVLLFSAEDDLFDTIRPRIDAAGGDPERIAAFVAIPDGTDTGRPFTLPRDLPILEAIVARLEVALVIIDPLVAFLRPGVSATSDQQVRHALGALKAVAERTGAAIVVVRHLNKTLNANPLYRGAGSIGIIAAARAGLLLAADPADPARRILAVAKSNLARPAPALAFRLEDVPGATVARVVWDGESPWTATQLLQTQSADGGEETDSVIDEARAWLRAALAGGPRLARELREDASEHGIGRNALYAARKAEGIALGKERITSGPWYWFYPHQLDGPAGDEG